MTLVTGLTLDPVPSSTMLELPDLLPLPLPASACLALLGCLLLAVALVLKTVFYRTPPETPELYFRESPLNEHILSKCKLRTRTFNPSPWLDHRHVQTLLPMILPRADVTYEREYLQMRDKGVVALDWMVHPTVKGKKRRGPVLLVVPSLAEGAVHVTHLCHVAASRGLRPVVFNRRGHGGSVLTTPRLQSFGDPSDLRQVIKYIKLMLPKAPIAAVAYGTGCGLLMSYLGEFGSSALLTVCACVSPCYDVPVRFSSPISNLFDLVLLLRLKSLVWKHAKALSSVVEVEKAVQSWTFPDLDRNLFCPLYGYSDLEQFWEVNNPIRDVDDIEVPVLCVNSLDDPTCACADIPYDLFKCYPNFLLAVTKRGGHCGFLEGLLPQTTSWSDQLCLDYVDSVLDFTAKAAPSPSQGHQNPSTKQSGYLRPRYHSVSVTSGYQHHHHHHSSNSNGNSSSSSHHHNTSQHRSSNSSHGKSRYLSQRTFPSNNAMYPTNGAGSSGVHGNGGSRCGSLSKKGSQRFTI